MRISDDTCTHPQLAVVGPGRLGRLITRILGLPEPFGRGFTGLRADGALYEAVLLCVPDAQIAAAANCLQGVPLIGHCSGSTGLEPLTGEEAFSMHPLMTITGADDDFHGAGAAIDGSTSRAIEFAAELAERLGLTPFRVMPEHRAAYHAAASIASNFLLTLESAAERLAHTAGVDREMLVPLVRATIENWARLGPRAALTGPIARGDTITVGRQRQAITTHAPEVLPLFDLMVRATGELAQQKATV